MQRRFQKIGVVAVTGLLLLYIGYRAWHAGGFENLLNELRGIGPVPNAEPTPLPSPTPTSSPATSSLPSPTSSAMATPTAVSAVMTRINQRRADAGIAAVAENAILKREAQEHAMDMVMRGYFDHTSPDGVTFQQRMGTSGYSSPAVAENLGLTSGNDATVVVSLWMDSQGHRENMLNPAYGAVGMGIFTGAWQGQQATFVVAIFGAAR